jgi:hypothetical protein
MSENHLTSWEYLEPFILNMWSKEEDLKTVIAEMIVCLEDPRVKQMKELLTKYYNLLNEYNMYKNFIEGEFTDNTVNLPGVECIEKIKQTLVMIQ